MTKTKWTVLILTAVKIIAALAVCYCCSHVAYKCGQVNAVCKPEFLAGHQITIHDDGSVEPLEALRALRSASKPVFKALLHQRDVTQDEMVDFMNAIIASNSVKELK